MLRGSLRALPIVVALALAASDASAQSRVAFLADQLRTATDFRVRTQAALALGASDDGGAVAPLCDGLDDTSDTVRSAAAAALGKLGKREGLECLKRHASSESSSAVKSVIARSMKALEAGAGGSATASSKPPPPAPGDKAYVAIGTTTDKTGRGGSAVAQLVRSAMQSKLLSMGGYAVAPDKESAGAARAVISKHKLKGYLLQASVEPPKYDGGDLTITVRVTMWTYPAKSLQGEFSPKMTMSGVSPGDTSSEDNLIRMAVERAVDSFVQVASSMD
jgi:hypothetical protein